MRILVVGGSDAGISAGLRAREVAPAHEVTLLLADEYPNFSICGLPFYLSGETPDWRALAHRTRTEIEGTGIEVLTSHRAIAIDSRSRRVRVRAANSERELPYDRLVIATGADPNPPRLSGIDLPGVYVLHTMDHAFALQRLLEPDARAVIIGAGYIGLEMADALRRRGMSVTLFQRGASPLPTIDPSLGDLLRAELLRNGVDHRGQEHVERMERTGLGVRVRTGTDQIDANLVVVATGVRPATALAAAVGVPLGAHDAIRVTRRMETGVPDVYAAGDCVETHHVLLGSTYLPLGTTAHKQGRIAGENAVGGEREFTGSCGTQVVKVFELAAARTGVSDGEARSAGFEPLTVEARAPDHKPYYPGAHDLRIRLTGDRRTHRLLGAQIVGDYRAQIAKRIDIVATAIFASLTVEAMSDLDLSYTPPLGSPWDALQVAAQEWERAAR